MNGIVFDLETQRLFKDAKESVKSLEKLSATEWATIEKNGIPKVPVWWTFYGNAQFKSVDTIKKYCSHGHDISDSELYYDFCLNELDGISPLFDNWRSMMTRRLCLAVAVTWDEQHSFRFWSESRVEALVQELSRYPFIVGANLINFDYCVLERYVPGVRELLGYKTVDLLAHARWGLFLQWIENELRCRGFSHTPADLRALWQSIRGNRKFELWDVSIWEKGMMNIPGFRVTLDNLARATLGKCKSGSALQAPQFFKEGKVKEVTDYCRNDVELTRDLFLHGNAFNKIQIKDIEAAVRWGEITEGLARLSIFPKNLVTERMCYEFQSGLALQKKNISLLEKSLIKLKAEELLAIRKQQREYHQQQLELKRSNPQWVKRQGELKEFRQIKQHGEIISSSNLASELGVKTSTVNDWSKVLNIVPPYCCGSYYYTLDQAAKIRQYGRLSHKEKTCYKKNDR